MMSRTPSLTAVHMKVIEEALDVEEEECTNMTGFDTRLD